MEQIIIKSKTGYEMIYDTQKHKIEIRMKNKKWKQSHQLQSSIRIEIEGDKYKLLLNDAMSITSRKYENGLGEGIKTIYSGFQVQGFLIHLTIETNIWIDKSQGALHMELIPVNEGQIQISTIEWPLPFEWNNKEEKAYTVLPMMQGTLIPSNWPKEVKLVEPYAYYERAAYMPWWGQVDGCGYIAIAETPWDGGYTLQHPAGGPTILQPIWYNSLGKVSYTRKLMYLFVERECDYNTLCKLYRNYVRHSGKFVTLAEKSIRNPNVEKLIGGSLVHHCIYKHVEPTSSLYDKEHPEQNDALVTFKETTKQLQILKQKGVDNVYLHLDGWGKRGYDNLHPDIFPPCEKAGGWEGLKHLANGCKEMGYLFGIHDQYRDYYKDAATFNLDHAMHSVHGTYFTESTWFGGEQAVLCTQLAPEYVRRNYNEFKENNIELKGTYLDVFSVIQLDECAHIEHRMTRKECMEKRMECLNYVRGEGLIASSEEVADWAVQCMELCHHAPYPLTPDLGEGEARGIPVPLFSLVYGECMVIPWGNTKGGWGIPKGEHGYLHGLLNGGIGYLDIDADEQQIKQNKVLGKHNKEVAKCERVKHEFVDGNYSKQRMYFANDTVVTVDFALDEYSISTLNGVIGGRMRCRCSN